MEYRNIKWNDEVYSEFMKDLKKLGDSQYREFHKKMITSDLEVIGIRTPLMKKIAKEIAKGDWKGFIKHGKKKYYEEINIKGLVIGYIKEDKSIIKDEIEKFISEINNWGVCDGFVSNLKILKKNRGYFYHIIKLMSKSNNQWELRFSLVSLLSYYVEREYLQDIFEICSSIKSEEYYVQMAQAWLISILFIKFRDETLEYLKNNSLNSWVQNKGIQKIRESSRVSFEDKELIKELRK